MGLKTEECRLRMYEPLWVDCAAVLIGCAIADAPTWILCVMATLFALICAEHNDIWES